MTLQENLFEPKKARDIKTVVHLEFDGGTPCNIPSKGYGIGYGSYRFDDRPPVRVDHGIPCSNNAAEILTLCVALETLATPLPGHPSPGSTLVAVYGDSQIALKWLSIATGGVPKRKKPKGPKGSELFIQAIERLQKAVAPFAEVTCHWQPRAKSVATFGH